MQREISPPNYKCTVCTKVYADPIACVQHIFEADFGDHGELNELPSGEIPMDEVQDAPDVEPASESVKEDVLADLGIEQDAYQMILNDEDIEVPEILTDSDLFNLGLLGNIELVHDEYVMITDRLSNIYDRLEDIDLDHGPVEEPVEEDVSEEEEEEPKENTQESGRFTHGDVLQREEEEVMRVLERGGVFDHLGDQAHDVFSYLYSKRDEDRNYSLAEISHTIGVEESYMEEIVDALHEEGFIEQDDFEDKFFYPY